MNLITPANKLKFNVRENIQKEEIVLELAQMYNVQIDTTNNKITNFWILITQKNNKIGQKTKMLEDILDSTLINGLQSFDIYESLNPVQISIKSNNIIADLNCAKNYIIF